MLYGDFRSEIKSGDIIAYTHRSWSTWYDIKIQLVRLFTRSEYTHVGVAWVVGSRVFILEAVVPLTRIYPLSKTGDFFHIGMNAKWNNIAEEYALSHIGYPYSQREAVEALFKPLGKDQVSQCAAYTLQVMECLSIYLGTVATPSAVVNKALELGAKLQLVNN
jgi:hypothetical protein